MPKPVLVETKRRSKLAAAKPVVVAVAAAPVSAPEAAPEPLTECQHVSSQTSVPAFCIYCGEDL